MRQLSDWRHISSMYNQSHFHRKNIANECVRVLRQHERTRALAAMRRECNEKDTSRNKLLRRTAQIHRNVMYSAARMSNAMGN